MSAPKDDPDDREAGAKPDEAAAPERRTRSLRPRRAKADAGPAAKAQEAAAPAEKEPAAPAAKAKEPAAPAAKARKSSAAKTKEPATPAAKTRKSPAAKAQKPGAPAMRSKRAAREHGDSPPMVRAHAKYVRTSARKARLVCDHIRGKSVQEARAILALTPRAVARDWSKLLESAVANAEHNHELLGDDLRIAQVTADEGPTLKRFRPRAMGRATRIRKRTSHLTILLTPKES
jgi:ribosomal protein L22